MENKRLAELRRDYSSEELSESAVDANPFVQFSIWMDEALASGEIDANAMTLFLGVQAETRIVPAETKPDCPFPEQLEIVPQANEGTVDITVPIDIPFSEVSRLLDAQIKDKTFPEDSAIEFHLTFDSEQEFLLGQGMVRWVSQMENIVGIEIERVQEKGRGWLARLADENKTVSFIPYTPNAERTTSMR